jgi:hypothetical protein
MLKLDSQVMFWSELNRVFIILICEQSATIVKLQYLRNICERQCVAIKIHCVQLYAAQTTDVQFD